MIADLSRRGDPQSALGAFAAGVAGQIVIASVAESVAVNPGKLWRVEQQRANDNEKENQAGHEQGDCDEVVHAGDCMPELPD